MSRKDSYINSDRRRKRAEGRREKVAGPCDTIGQICAWNATPLVLLASMYFQRLIFFKLASWLSVFQKII